MSYECTCYKLHSLTELCPHCEYASENCCSLCGADVKGKFAYKDDDEQHCKECEDNIKAGITEDE